MKKVFWALLLLATVGCTNKERASMVVEETPQKPVEKTIALKGPELQAPDSLTYYTAQLANGLNVWIQVCKEDIFRVRITPRATPQESLMERYGLVKADWVPVATAVEADSLTYKVWTPTHLLALDKATGVLTLTDKATGKAVIEKLLFRTGKDSLCENLGKAINEKFLNIKVAKNNGIIGDDTKKFSVFDKVETGDYKKNSIISIALQPEERFYGGGSTSREHIQHRGELLRMWTTYQHTENPQPFMMSSNNWAIYNNDTRKQFFDVGCYKDDEFSIYNTFDEGDFYLMAGDNKEELIDHYTEITGRPILLPKWAYGLCFGPNMRENQYDIMRDAVLLRDMEFPCDLLWLEPQWMEKRYDFSTAKRWNYQLFAPEPYWLQDQFPKKEYPHQFIGRLHQMGYHLGLWLCLEYDPSIDEEDTIAVATGGKKSGKEHWVDHLKNFVDFGADGFKLDPARTIDEHPTWRYYNGKTDKEMHNINQVLMPKQVAQMFEGHTGRRSWHHYCGGWAGTQHWTAANSGDNGGTRTALFDQVNLGMSGFMNTSCDIMSTDDPTIEMQSLHFGMFLPWAQINSWFSLMHPFYYGGKNKNVYVNYVRLRYSLIPYIYSAALEGAQTGMPIVRGMPLAFPDDRKVDDMAYQYMFGPNFLVGVFGNDIYLPEGEWIDFWTGERLQGGESIEHAYPADKAGLLFVRQGAIIPMQKPMSYVGEEPLDTLILKVFPKGKSSYTLYEDDGLTLKYREGEIAATRFDCEQDGRKVTLTVQPLQGKYEGCYDKRTYDMQVWLEKKPSGVKVDGHSVDWEYDKEKKVLVFSADQPDVNKKMEVVIK